MKIISARENPDKVDMFIKYFQEKWASEESLAVYDDCIRNCICTPNPLPDWFLLLKKEKIIGCAGVITNDFISRMDLYPWLCALYVEEEYRGNSCGKLLIERCKKFASDAGFKKIYLCTDHKGYYEKYGFSFVATGYHPWGESSGIYESELE